MNNYIGKRIKLNNYNLEFGKKAKEVNVIAFFKYKIDNNFYVVCCEESNVNYGIINYGSAHIKGNSIIIIGVKEPLQEMVQELFFKLNEGSDISDTFEIMSLNDIYTIEFVTPNKIELKNEIVKEVIDKVIEKEKEEVITTVKKNEKKGSSLLPLILLFIAICVGIFFYFFIYLKPVENKIYKSIECTKTTNDNKYNMKIEEDNKFRFSQNDTLEYIDELSRYVFFDEDEYFDFINKGLMYKYLADEEAGYSQDESTFSFSITKKVDATSDSYVLPTEYEDVLSYYVKDGYSCTELTEE